jgi:hypothetical protein
MPVTINGSILFTGRVLSHSRGHYHVPSDNAMIDDGSYVSVSVWDDEYRVTRNVEYYTGRSGCHVPVVTDDADAETQSKAAEYESSWGSISHLFWCVREARHRKPGAGDKVTVFKGRKVRKGEYTVEQAGSNDYGKYFHLRAGDGKVYRYINPDNCKFDPTPYMPPLVPAYAPLLISLADIGLASSGELARDRQRHLTLLALADALEERGDGRATHVRAYAMYYTNPENMYDRLYSRQEIA